MRCPRMIVVGFSALLVAVTAAPAFAGYGAVAFDEKTGRHGASWNEDTQKRADDAALKGCEGTDCKVISRIAPRKCGAFATNETGKAWGGKSDASTRDAAKLAAIENCQKRTKSKCVVRESECNR